MSKKGKNKKEETKPVETTVTENVTETEATVTETTETTENVTETTETEIKVEEKVLPDVSAKDAFLAALYANGGKYALSVNGVQLCTYQNNPVIVAYDTYFEMNGNRHSFNGIEIKHIN